ncbi:MAG: hypothetical protein H0W54_03975 [Rubrobacter sp.]|nr:hypothetical protein [Rubrobacter sp.]
MTENESARRPKVNLLGVAAYALVLGERRKQALVHFRKAGFEALKGIGALARQEGKPATPDSNDRERIKID